MECLKTWKLRPARLQRDRAFRDGCARYRKQFQGNLTSSDGNPEVAIEAAAVQHGVDTATVREIIARAGGLESEIGDNAEHSVKPGDI